MLDDDARFQIINQRFPHIGTKLRALWEQPGIDAYFKVWLNETGGSSCLGFPKDVVAALRELRATHEKSFVAESAERLFPVATELAGNENFPIVNERFPHIGEKLAVMWGSHVFSGFINGLFHDTRGGARKGFPKEISVALFRLMQEHDRLFPELAYQAQDIWSLNNRE
ncbi:MAG: hypothetical protein WBK19_14825 [Azonexus sp.]